MAQHSLGNQNKLWLEQALNPDLQSAVFLLGNAPVSEKSIWGLKKKSVVKKKSGAFQIFLTTYRTHQNEARSYLSTRWLTWINYGSVGRQRFLESRDICDRRTLAEALEMIPQLFIWFNDSPGSVAGIVKASCFSPRVKLWSWTWVAAVFLKLNVADLWMKAGRRFRPGQVVLKVGIDTSRS